MCCHPDGRIVTRQRQCKQEGVLCVGTHDIIRNSCETFKDADLAEDLEIEINMKK